MKKRDEYKIGEVASLLGINTSVLRFWEKEFPWIAPKRTEKKHRVYTEESIERVRVIQNLLYDKGMTIEGAKKLLKQKRGTKSISDIVKGTTTLKDTMDKETVKEDNIRGIIEELEELRTLLSLDMFKK